MKNISEIANCVIVLHDMGVKLNEKSVPYYFADCIHYYIQMIVMLLEPAQKDNMAMASTVTFYIITFNGADLFKILQDTYKCEHDFYELFDYFEH